MQLIKYSIADTLSPRIIKDGYKQSGQYPFNFAYAMNHQCDRELSISQFQAFEEALSPAAAIFREKGVLTEQDMDELNVPSWNHELKRTTPKDQRLLHHQRAILLNSGECVKRFKIHITNKERDQMLKDQRKTLVTKEQKHIYKVEQKKLLEEFLEAFSQ